VDIIWLPLASSRGMLQLVGPIILTELDWEVIDTAISVKDSGNVISSVSGFLRSNLKDRFWILPAVIWIEDCDWSLVLIEDVEIGFDCNAYTNTFFKKNEKYVTTRWENKSTIQNKSVQLAVITGIMLLNFRLNTLINYNRSSYKIPDGYWYGIWVGFHNFEHFMTLLIEFCLYHRDYPYEQMQFFRQHVEFINGYYKIRIWHILFDWKYLQLLKNNT
jgi:hypothetical protein